MQTSEAPDAPVLTASLSPVILAAHAAESLTVGMEAELAAPGGVPIAAQDGGVLVLVPERLNRAHRLARPTVTGARPDIVQFEGGEHTFLGDRVQLRFDDGVYPAASSPLHLPNGLVLTYGQLLALGGDFYGLPDAPISDGADPRAVFTRAWASLAVATSAVAEAPQILAVMQTEIDTVNQAIARGEPASRAYAALGDSLSEKWNRITGGGSVVSPWLPMGRYVLLAATNWDHFGAHAVAAYSAGHAAAIVQAIAARSVSDPGERRVQLERAYAMNAFADHFLSDLFSSGHVRTPRKELSATVTPAEIGSYLARFMHDEDSCWGLTVKNAVGSTWTAYGDKRFFDDVNAANVRAVESAVQASVNDIVVAYQKGGAPPTFAALRLTPDLAAVADPTQRQNASPLFVAADGTTLRRTQIDRRDDYTWTKNWWGWSTLTLLQKSDAFTKCEAPGT